MRQLLARGLGAVLALVVLALSVTTSQAIEIKRTKLNNGAVLLVSEQHHLPMVSIAIAFDAGARRDPSGKEGLAELTASSLEQGTKQLSVGDFNQKVDSMGSSIAIGADRDYVYASMTSLKKYEADTLHLLAQSLENPGLRDSDIIRKRDEQVAAIKANEEEPGYTAMVAFAKQLFGDAPYGHPTEGLPGTVAKLTPSDVRDFYHRYYRTGGAVVAVAGDVAVEAIKPRLEQELSGLAGTVPAQPEPAWPSIRPGIHAELINRNVAQANLILGSGGIARSNPDYYRVEVMNYILGGGGFSSRLMKVVRSKAGLAYSIDSAFSAGKFPGAFAVVLQTKNQSAQQALRLILEQLREIQDQAVSDAEIASAKKYMIGSFPLRLDRQSQIVSFMLQIELYGLGLDYAERYPKLIGDVTALEVRETAQKYLHPNALDLVAVANQSLAKINTAALSPPVTAKR
ncbi:MAG: insulinase family protein [Deltaproteobacteria bacterium]|nr:insulinase family protein [Deltaproteobacteria bacterium]